MFYRRNCMWGHLYTRGFTLIELLIVIAIIGLLGTLSITSLLSARAKARDARRINDVQQMANVLSLESSGGGNVAANLEGCGDAINETNTRTCTGPGNVSYFPDFFDPSIINPDDDATICKQTTPSTDVCQYSLASGSTNVENSLILFFLETDLVGYNQGLHVISPEGIIN